MKTLHDLNDKELKELYDKNQDLRNQAWRNAYDDNMFCLEQEFKEMGAEVFDYHDHYSSFYLSTPTIQGAKAPEKVAGKLEKDYMNPDNAKLYEKLCKLNDEWEKLDYDDQDENSELYQNMTETCDQLAEGLTDQFREYENVDDDYVYDLFKQSAYDGYMSDWTINEKGEVTETIYKTYK